MDDRFREIMTSSSLRRRVSWSISVPGPAVALLLAAGCSSGGGAGSGAGGSTTRGTSGTGGATPSGGAAGATPSGGSTGTGSTTGIGERERDALHPREPVPDRSGGNHGARNDGEHDERHRRLSPWRHVRAQLNTYAWPRRFRPERTHRHLPGLPWGGPSYQRRHPVHCAHCSHRRQLAGSRANDHDIRRAAMITIHDSARRCGSTTIGERP